MTTAATTIICSRDMCLPHTVAVQPRPPIGKEKGAGAKPVPVPTLWSERPLNRSAASPKLGDGRAVRGSLLRLCHRLYDVFPQHKINKRSPL
jgi:hypothetical protein